MSQPPFSGPPYPEQPSSGQPWNGQPPYGAPQPPAGQPHPPQYGQQPPAQPAYGAPQPPYGAPQQPQYGAPQPPQYGAPQPGFGPPQPSYPTPQPPRKSRAVPIVLISVAVVLVLCVGGSTAFYLAARNTVDEAAKVVETAYPGPTTKPPTTRPTTRTPTVRPALTITVTEPSRLGGRPKLTDPQFTDIAESIESNFADLPGAGRTVSAIYGSPAKRNVVMMAAAEVPVPAPELMLDSTFKGNGLNVKDVRDVSSGALGGAAKCGVSNEDDLDIVLCGWADRGSIGYVAFYFQSTTKARAEFPRLRAEIEKAR